MFVIVNIVLTLIAIAVIYIAASLLYIQKIERRCLKRGGHFPCTVTDLIELTTVIRCTKCGKILKEDGTKSA